jgi:hypothetical protein
MAELALGRALLFRGELAAAETAAERALAQLAVYKPLQIGAYALYIQLLLVLGRVAEARRAATAGLAVLTDLGGVAWQDLALWLAAIEVELADGNQAVATGLLRPALATLRERSEQIPQLLLREHYLTRRRENARLLALGQLLLDE